MIKISAKTGIMLLTLIVKTRKFDVISRNTLFVTFK